MKYDFNEVHNRLGTYCTQWDYIQDRFNKKDLIPFSISDTDFIIPKPITEKIFEIILLLYLHDNRHLHIQEYLNK